MDQTDTAVEPDIDYADIWAELAAWDAASDEALELVLDITGYRPERSVTNCGNN